MKLIIRWQALALWSIALLGFLLRVYGLDWDQGNSFHPDERQILFHVTALTWPRSLAQFLDAASSPLNPHFFAYGSFPLYLLAWLGSVLVRISPTLGTFAHLTLVGRVLSAIFDSGTILLTGCLGLLLMRDDRAGQRFCWQVALLAAALVAFTPLQLQLSHFYAVDTMLLFFVTLTVLGCVALVNTNRPLLSALVIGLGYGLGLATKFSAAPLAVPLLVAALLRWYRCDFFSAFSSLMLAATTTIFVFFVAEPYALLDLPNFVQRVSEQGSLARGMLDLPYVRQFAGTIPYVYEAQNMLLWGLGVFLALAACVGFIWLLWRIWRREAGLWAVILCLVTVYGAIMGSFYVKFMRYMLPVYPFLTLMAASVLVAFASYYWKRGQGGARAEGSATKAGGGAIRATASTTRATARVAPTILLRNPALWVIALVLAGTIFQGLALLNVYSTPNTRVQASRWMYSHLPRGSVLTYEQWDDALPVAVDGHDPTEFMQAIYLDANKQPTTGLDLYGEDTINKARQLATLLPTLNAITMASDRLDKSIPRLPLRYPLTIHYYHLLFNGQLGFHLAARFENHPHLFGITLDDSSADESYSVFDHPTVRIFVRDDPYPYTSQQLLGKLLQGVQ